MRSLEPTGVGRGEFESAGMGRASSNTGRSALSAVWPMNRRIEKAPTSLMAKAEGSKGPFTRIRPRISRPRFAIRRVQVTYALRTAVPASEFRASEVRVYADTLANISLPAGSRLAPIRGACGGVRIHSETGSTPILHWSGRVV